VGGVDVENVLAGGLLNSIEFNRLSLTLFSMRKLDEIAHCATYTQIDVYGALTIDTVKTLRAKTFSIGFAVAIYNGRIVCLFVGCRF